MTPQVQAAARQFIESETQFHLGFLPTEQSNPLTRTLSDDYAADTRRGVRTLQRADRPVLEMARRMFASPEYRKLSQSVLDAIAGGRRVVFSGCGATGRLSIMMESLWREGCARHSGLAGYADRVESIMTGGDYALVKSVEFFEDFAVFGRRQVEEARLGAGDVLVAITEGGETSSVLGTVEEGLARGVTVFLLFNNPATLLAERLERSRRAIEDPRVTVLDLFCGPMALAGSTRMQATTAEQLIAGAAMESAMHALLGQPVPDYADDFARLLERLGSDANVRALAAYTDFEADVYRQGGHLTYFADEGLLDIFTDTTERSPTFMLPPFRKCDDTTSPPPWTFVMNPLRTTEQVWQIILRRPLRCLEWTTADYAAMGTAERIGGNPPRISSAELLKFQVGKEAIAERQNAPGSAAVLFSVADNPALAEAFAELSPGFTRQAVLAIDQDAQEAFSLGIGIRGGAVELMRHLAFKLVLNTISTGTMVLLGRVTGNWMSWVDCTNKKLLDRGARLLVEIAGVDYPTAVTALFEAMEHLKNCSGEKPSPVQAALQLLQNRSDYS